LSAVADLIKVVFVQAEVVADFVEDSLADLLEKLPSGPAYSLDVEAIDDDPVGQTAAVLDAAVGQGDSTVHTEELPAVVNA
jgi:hypothetical protein